MLHVPNERSSNGDVPLSLHDRKPEFGADVDHSLEPCGPRDLYCRLLDIEENVHYHEPAFRFAAGAVGSPHIASWVADAIMQRGEEFVPGLLQRAITDLEEPAITAYATSWPVSVAREFAPLGLTDGVWLRGAVQFHMVESGQGAAALGQLMIHFAGPGVGEPYAQKYAALLSSLGIVPASIGRLGPEGEAPCADISYEHALLAPCLALFPSVLAAETLGFNLWMAAIGPCPLLAALCGRLHKGANLRYFEEYDREHLSEFAIAAVRALLAEENDSDAARDRVARGFAAAHRSYKRWHLAMLGANVPMTARDIVIDIIAPKARFAIGHHLGVHLGERSLNLETCFARGREGYEQLLDALAESPLIHPGAPDQSPFVTSSIQFGGPMFEVFTPLEQASLREWISALPDEKRAQRPVPVELEGTYTPPQDPNSLRGRAIAQYATISPEELLYRLLNSDRYPPVRVFGRLIVSNALEALASALNDPRLDSAAPPPYSEQAIAEIVAQNHTRNVRVRAQSKDPCSNASTSTRADIEPENHHDGVASVIHASVTADGTHNLAPGAPLDGCWLGGFVDVHRIALEEYGWLFRIYAGELGDGHLEWNHNYILRRMHIENGMAPAHALLSLRDRRLYDVVQVTIAEIVMIAMSLNTRYFLPEMLGMNLFIEAKGVGGYYLTTEEAALREGKSWTALSMRLHNAIDNYASGHTQWSVAAIQAFMTRLQDAGPRAQAEQWHRIWRLWRFNELRDYGTSDQQQALEERLGSVATESFVPSEL